MKNIARGTVILLVIGLGLIGVTQTLPACQNEDSDNCSWDASTQGNGVGRSFTVRDGVVTYKDGE